MEYRVKGWTGKRLFIDLGIQRAWTEEIPEGDLERYIGGRGLNGNFFLERVDPSLASSSPENPIAFSIGPLAGTFAPCSGWTSISTLSPNPYSPRYAHASLPGHWGPQLKFSGFDQLIIKGKADKPLYLAMDGEKVSFEDARSLWGKDTAETTVAIQKEKKDRNIEVLCIGPAGENLIFSANVTNRFSWTADHIGLGYLFGSKNLKAIAIRGKEMVSLHDPDRFLHSCVTLRERIHRDPNASRLKEEGPFLLLRQKDGGLGIKNYNEVSHPDFEARWGAAYFTNHFYGKEACFSCPIHCGRISDVNGNYFGGVHVESAWSLGPKIGIEAWEKTLLLHRICQLQGLDPSSAGSLLAWLMDCCEKGILSPRDLGSIPLKWGDEKAALQWIEWIVEGKETGEILGQGCLHAANSLGKGLDQVPHFWGMDLPVRDPHSSMQYALSRALFPMEWDYLQSLNHPDSLSSSSTHPREAQQNGVLERVLALEKQQILADLNSLCPLVVARLPLLSTSDIEELLFAATGKEKEDGALLAAVARTMQIEKTLRQKIKSEDSLGLDPFPLRLFDDPEGKRDLENEIAHYNGLKESDLLKEETIDK